MSKSVSIPIALRTAAERAGLTVGDEIVAVNDVEVEGKSHEEIVSYIQEELFEYQFSSNSLEIIIASIQNKEKKISDRTASLECSR
ncbi:unnamed protein product [Nippostrongylus brasiliensis]|uniref:PDZ domain-containing protein n=1 Tax=Nippostrongylus brasiliensis TaxID=27835 RepID=A0A0N4YH90_NIPBR|nr:unnamed protein product [Nippostrongylus brasiliensis]